MAQEQTEGVEQVVVDGDRVALTVDRTLYPLDAIYGASYLFIDRCYVLLDSPDADHVQVELRGREATSQAALEQLVGEFGNELLSQVWRHQTAQNNRLVIEAITAKAMSGALGAPEPPDLQEGFDADAFDDPLGIAVPWEEKYGKAAGDTAAGGDAAEAPDSTDDALADPKPGAGE